jgi:hypothetical protein
MTAEQRQLVWVALLPDRNRAIDIVLENLYPSHEAPDHTTVLHLEEIDEPEKAIARKVMAAGAALDLVVPDPDEPLTYHVHGEFYRLLASLRSTSNPVLSNGLHDGPTKKDSPNEADIAKALEDVASGRSDYVILSRSADENFDYIQIGAGPAPFHLECRVWLNENVAEHYHILRSVAGDEEEFADVGQVKTVMLHWLNAGRLPNTVGVRSMPELCEPPRSKAKISDGAADN